MSNKDEHTSQTLWKDRRRILGLPLSFTRYEVTETRLITRKGFFSTETNEVLLYRILDFKLIRKFSQKIFGVGTIVLYSADKSDGELRLVNIKKPDAVRKFISNIVENERNVKGITGREIYGAASMPSSAGQGYTYRDADGDGIPD